MTSSRDKVTLAKRIIEANEDSEVGRWRGLLKLPQVGRALLYRLQAFVPQRPSTASLPRPEGAKICGQEFRLRCSYQVKQRSTEEPSSCILLEAILLKTN